MSEFGPTGIESSNPGPGSPNTETSNELTLPNQATAEDQTATEKLESLRAQLDQAKSHHQYLDQPIDPKLQQKNIDTINNQRADAQRRLAEHKDNLARAQQGAFDQLPPDQRYGKGVSSIDHAIDQARVDLNKAQENADWHANYPEMHRQRVDASQREIELIEAEIARLEKLAKQRTESDSQQLAA